MRANLGDALDIGGEMAWQIGQKPGTQTVFYESLQITHLALETFCH